MIGLMPLTENQDRHNALVVAREERLYRDPEGVYWLASGEGGPPVVASAGFTTAVGELLADTPPALTEGAADPVGNIGIPITEDGDALLDTWNQNA